MQEELGKTIPLDKGSDLTKNYRDVNPNKVKGFAVSKDLIEDILEQDDCDGLRVYNALDEDSKPQLVVVGIDSSENDLTSGVIISELRPCPSYCGGNNTLNS